MEIVSHPSYVKSGTKLTLVCQNRARATIEWVKRTAETSLQDEAIDPEHKDVVIQSCTDEPSGFTKSTLFRSNMSLNARGWYKCRNTDDSSSYKTYVSVIYSMLIAFICLKCSTANICITMSQYCFSIIIFRL